MTQDSNSGWTQTGVGGRMDELSARNHLECHPAVPPSSSKGRRRKWWSHWAIFLIFSYNKSKMLIERNEKWTMLTCKIAFYTLMSNFSWTNRSIHTKQSFLSPKFNNLQNPIWIFEIGWYLWKLEQKFVWGVFFWHTLYEAKPETSIFFQIWKSCRGV